MSIKNKSKAEFILSLKGNVICQRHITLYEPLKEINDFEVQLCLKQIESDIQADLLKKSDGITNSKTNETENYTLVVKYLNEPIGRRMFDATVYPPKVRYNVDIKPKIKNYIELLKNVLINY